MTALLLHLSDIHIRSATDPILARGKEIAACTFQHLPAASHVFILVSGDIAFSGTRAQYELAEKLLGVVRDLISAERPIPVSFVLAPGNHDCDFNLDTGARATLIRSMEVSDVSDIDESYITICTSVQHPFFEFRDRLEAGRQIDDDLLWRHSSFEVDGKEVAFECLNVSWTSKISESPGKLFFPVGRYSNVDRATADVRFVVIHHPLNWYSQAIYRPFRTMVRNLANVVVSGHEHQGNVGINIDSESAESAYIEGCVLQGESDLSDSSLMVAEVDVQSSQFSLMKYVWSETAYILSEKGSWVDYRKLPLKKTNKYQVSDTFQKEIEDPGASLWHPGKASVCLSDVYVFPDLLLLGVGAAGERTTVSAKNLLSPEETDPGIIVEAEEKAGSTSLLFQLYRNYQGRGFVPVYLQGRDLRRAEDREIDALLRRMVEAQYGKGSANEFFQEPRDNKILLLDDFDDSPVRAGRSRAILLEALQKRFARMVITVGDVFEIGEMMGGEDPSSAITALTRYRMQPFGYARRTELIERWFSLDSTGSIDEDAFIGKCDQADKLMNAVMIKSVVPALPLYLLALLQSIEGGQVGELRDTGLGHYYQYLLTEAFARAGVRKEKLTEIFHYSAHMAWEFHRRGVGAMSSVELRRFNDDFSKRWVTVDFGNRIDVLVKARVLMIAGDEYKFRYPYVYYYLKGIYLSENFEQAEVQQYVAHCSRHLYVRDHANSMLFLAHHRSDDRVISAIAGSLQRLFPTKAPVTYGGDTSGVAALIESAPALVYSGEQPREARRRRSEVQDDLDDGSDGLADREEESDELSLVAQMTMLFRVTEILGQVLKNQYSKIERARKAELLVELFNGPLRAVRDFYDFLEKNPNSIVTEIDAVLARRTPLKNEQSRKSAARRIVADMVQLISFGFVLRAASAASADTLLEDVQKAVYENKTIAFRLIEIGVILDSPRPLPRAKLSELSRDVSMDPVASRILRLLVINRLYMFRTSEKDMQWLKEEINIDLVVQHRIAYQDKKAKRLN